MTDTSRNTKKKAPNEPIAELERFTELERSAAESALRAETTANELEAFGSALSHDLRAPLRSIEGFSRLLLEPPYVDQLDATGKDYLLRVHRASLKLSQMMEDLLQLVRLARGGIKPERVDLSALAREILAALQSQAPQRRADITVEAGIVATGDPRLLRLVMENLLDNAWKFSGGKTRAEIYFGRASDAGTDALCVRDNGSGFEQRYAERLFRPFQRLHSESEFPGAGIGLAKAQRAIHAHGGRIWACAQRDAGATFYFTLPATDTAQAA